MGVMKTKNAARPAGNVSAVLDGDLDAFIEAYILSQGAEKPGPPAHGPGNGR